MKNFLALLIFTAFLIAGCSDYNTTPVDNTKGSASKISLPQRDARLSAEAVYTASESISGNTGGDVALAASYTAINGSIVTMDAKVDISASAYSGTKVISITNDGQYVEVDLSPSMTFNAPVYLSVKMTGVDVTGLNSGNVDFVYVASDGTMEHVPSQSLAVNQNGTLQVTNAVLSHFSRYAFVKSKVN